MQDCNPVTTSLDTSIKLIATTNDEAIADFKEYANRVEGLMFAVYVTKPDIMCAIRQLFQFFNKPSSKHLLAVKCVLHYLKGTFS